MNALEKVATSASPVALRVHQVLVDLCLDSHEHAVLGVVLCALEVRDEVSIFFSERGGNHRISILVLAIFLIHLFNFLAVLIENCLALGRVGLVGSCLRV